MQRPTNPISTLNTGVPEVSRNWELDCSLIETALEKSPTGGNAKPFSWTWQGRTLQIRHNSEYAKHYLNRNQHTSLIALGCLIASVEIAARFQGFDIESDVMIQNLSAQLKFIKNDHPEKGFEDFQALLKRHTVRGEFSPSQKPTLTALRAMSPIQIHLTGSQEISKEMKTFLTAADTYLWLQNQATQDFLNEIQFTKLPQTKYEHGIRVVDLGVGKMDQMLLKVFSLMPWLPTLFARIPGLNFSFKAASQRSQKNSHYVLISARDLRPESLIKAGQEALKAWVNLEKQGFKVQPISMASITLVDAATGVLPDDTAPGFHKLFKHAGPEILCKQFHLRSNEKPVWLLRVGV